MVHAITGACMPARPLAGMYTRVRTCSHTFTHVHTRSHMLTSVHTCPNVFTHVHTCAHMLTHVHTQINGPGRNYLLSGPGRNYLMLGPVFYGFEVQRGFPTCFHSSGSLLPFKRASRSMLRQVWEISQRGPEAHSGGIRGRGMTRYPVYAS